MEKGEFTSAVIMMTDEPDTDLFRHFSHFLMEYFIDVAVWSHDNPGRKVFVLDCGPCNPWFELLSPVATISVVSPTTLRDLAMKQPDNVRVIRGRHGFDIPDLRKRLRRFLRLFIKNRPAQDSKTRVFALRPGDDQRFPSGSWMRRIDNELQLSRFLSNCFSFDAVDFFDVTPRQAIDLMSTCRLFVAQRGAALMNLVFMPKGSTVIEIYPRDFEAVGSGVDLYRRMCTARGLRFVRIYQRNKFSAVSPLRLFFVILWIRLTSR